MRNSFSKQQSVYFLLFLAFPAALFAAQQQNDVRQWLVKMQRATHTLNYTGTFVYGHHGQLSTINIIHRVNQKREQERLIALDGTGREVIRDGSKVTCILPDSKAVVVSKSRKAGTQFPPVFPINMDKLASYYNFSLAGKGRVAGRVTQRINISPKDQFRYGHQLWVDEKTGLLLKTSLLNERNKPVEQFMFTRIEFLSSIADKLLAPTHDGQGFTWYEANEGKTTAANDEKMSTMKVVWLPPGFQHDVNNTQKLPNSAMPVEHMVFSDGLASVSVFIEEELQHDPANLVGGSRMGGISAHGRGLGDYHVTVVGEVPHITVQKISDSVQYESDE